ncbi:MAG: GHMP family kinase ATP-binding protein [Chloroflexota bacterium]
MSTTIDKYVYVHVSPNGLGDAQITSADYQTFYRHHCGTPMSWDGDLSLPRAVLHEFGVERGVSIFVASEVPPGTGLGSSSAVAVALVKAVGTHLGRSQSPREVAEVACRIELGKLKAPIGKQDQFAAAFGGLNAIMFEREGVLVQPLSLSADLIECLERRLLLFFTRTARDSADILREQQRASSQGRPQTVDGLHRIKAAAMECRKCLEAGRLDDLGALLDAGWREKRRLVAGITNPWIDEIYEKAIKSGAIGGKITGAGGGGFLLLYCHEKRQEALTEALEKLGLRRMDFHFEKYGVATVRADWRAGGDAVRFNTPLS